MSFREYEVKNKPLFASMKRAKTALLKEHAKACSIDSFFAYMEKRYGVDSECIEYITFYDYVFDSEAFHYNIAYIYTTPSLKMRDILFEDREEITKDTGWYPMVSGSRANFTSIKIAESYKYWNIVRHKPPYVHLGKPISIKSVACDISSTALMLKCEKGNILLDTGFEVEEDNISDVDFIFMSHFHRDHSGGLYGFLKKREVPVILSGITLGYLLNLRGIDVDDKRRLLKNAVLIESIKERSYINNTIEFFNSYHCPGAYGLKYKCYGEVVIYPGDICLLNGFYDFSDKFQRVINHTGKANKSIITDCALVPRGDFAITDKDFEAVAESILSSEHNQIFVSRGAEMLFNVYIRLFRMAIDEHKDWLFIVNDELFYLLRNVLRNWLLPEYKGDPFVEHVIGKSGINYAETQRLYPISAIEQFDGYNEKRIMYLVTLNDIQAIEEISDTSCMDMYLTGPLALAKNLEETLGNCQFNSVHKLSSPDWSFHSDKEAIRELINDTVNDDTKLILFHAFPKVIKKFIKEFPLEVQDKLGVVSQTELKF